MESIIYQTASRLAQAIQNREVTSEAVVRAHLDHIEKHNAALNAIVILTAEAALQRARAADAALARGEIWGPLHGVPMTIKEVFEIKGLKTTVNFKLYKNHVAKDDALVVTRLKKAGAVILGKTNIPPLLADYQTDGPIYGRTNNPYDLARTPGGSTGGGAAAVAAGLSPLELGSDMGGSLRIPTHYCGLYSLKPTENTIPLHGHMPRTPNLKGGVLHMANFGPLARSLEDVKRTFDVIKGPDHRDVNVVPIQWKAPSGRALSDYRLAWTDTFGPHLAGRETRLLLGDLAQEIGRRGATVMKQHPPHFDFEKAWEVWGNIFGYVMGEDMPPPVRVFSRIKWAVNYKGPAVKGLRKGLRVNFVQYARTLKKRDDFISQLQAFFDEVDFWLCPVAMTPAFPHCKPGTPIVVDGRKVDYLTAAGAFVTLFNMTGHPALIIPLGQSSEGLPIGVQIVGPYWSEPELFHFAGHLAALTPGFQAPKGYAVL